MFWSVTNDFDVNSKMLTSEGLPFSITHGAHKWDHCGARPSAHGSKSCTVIQFTWLFWMAIQQKNSTIRYYILIKSGGVAAKSLEVLEDILICQLLWPLVLSGTWRGRKKLNTLKRSWKMSSTRQGNVQQSTVAFIMKCQSVYQVHYRLDYKNYWTVSVTDEKFLFHF